MKIRLIRILILNSTHTTIMSFSVVSKKSEQKHITSTSRLKSVRGGGITNLYYFGGEKKEGHLDKLPDGYTVIENERTGLPMLKKKV